jgi:hypothetical protein
MDQVDLRPYRGKEETERLYRLAIGIEGVFNGPLDADKAEAACKALADMELRSGDLYVSLRERLNAHNKVKEN